MAKKDLISLGLVGLTTLILAGDVGNTNKPKLKFSNCYSSKGLEKKFGGIVTEDFLNSLLIKYSLNSKLLNHNFLKSLVYAESEGDSKAISPKGAIGLFQILESTKDWMVKEKMITDGDLFDPDYNTHAGTTYLNYLENFFRKHHKSWSNLSLREGQRYIATTYNCGPTYMKNKIAWDIKRAPEESINHASKILKRISKLENL